MEQVDLAMSIQPVVFSGHASWVQLVRVTAREIERFDPQNGSVFRNRARLPNAQIAVAPNGLTANVRGLEIQRRGVLLSTHRASMKTKTLQHRATETSTETGHLQGFRSSHNPQSNQLERQDTGKKNPKGSPK